MFKQLVKGIGGQQCFISPILSVFNPLVKGVGRSATCFTPILSVYKHLVKWRGNSDMSSLILSVLFIHP